MLGPLKRVIPAAETEVLPPLPTLTFSVLGDLPPATSFLSTAFVLPLPSPDASLPSNPALLLPNPLSAPDFGVAKIDNHLAPPEIVEPPDDDDDPTTPPPARKPFPVAKPFAQRMMHAYSPVKPSPLSRILMLSDIPPTGVPPIAAPKLGHLLEDFLSPEAAVPRPRQQESEMTLVQELGITESPSETPLQEKKSVPNVVPNKSTTTKGRVLAQGAYGHCIRVSSVKPPRSHELDDS